MNEKIKAIILFSRIMWIVNDHIDAMEIKNFLLIWRNAGFCLLNIPYTNPIQLDSDMLAGLLRTIQQVMNDGIRRITWKHQTILFEFADELLYVLIMSSVSNESIYRNRLIKVRDSIRRRFRERPEWSRCIEAGQLRSIRECALDVIQSFHLRNFDLDLTPKLLENHRDIPFAVREFDEILEQLIGFIDGKRTIYQIIDDSGNDRKLVLGLISVLYHYEWIEIVRAINIEDKLILVQRPTEKELGSFGPKELLWKLFHDFTMAATCKEVAEIHGLDSHVVLFLAGKLLERGVLTYVK
ncbi:MAG: hypothetical protein RTU63_08620 [Candidatus Thorarchaeota archaeon]